MFHLPDDRNSMKLGERNAASVKLALKKCNIPLVAEDTGGQYGRTILLEYGNRLRTDQNDQLWREDHLSHMSYAGHMVLCIV